MCLLIFHRGNLGDKAPQRNEKENMLVETSLMLAQTSELMFSSGEEVEDQGSS